MSCAGAPGGDRRVANRSARLQHRIGALQLGGGIEVTGFVTDHEYRNWINHAVCAVQIRAHSQGEGSAAVREPMLGVR